MMNDEERPQENSCYLQMNEYHANRWKKQLFLGKTEEHTITMKRHKV